MTIFEKYKRIYDFLEKSGEVRWIEIVNAFDKNKKILDGDFMSRPTTTRMINRGYNMGKFHRNEIYRKLGKNTKYKVMSINDLEERIEFFNMKIEEIKNLREDCDKKIEEKGLMRKIVNEIDDKYLRKVVKMIVNLQKMIDSLEKSVKNTQGGDGEKCSSQMKELENERKMFKKLQENIEIKIKKKKWFKFQNEEEEYLLNEMVDAEEKLKELLLDKE